MCLVVFHDHLDAFRLFRSGGGDGPSVRRRVECPLPLLLHGEKVSVLVGEERAFPVVVLRLGYVVIPACESRRRLLFVLHGVDAVARALFLLQVALARHVLDILCVCVYRFKGRFGGRECGIVRA